MAAAAERAIRMSGVNVSCLRRGSVALGLSSTNGSDEKIRPTLTVENSISHLTTLALNPLTVWSDDHARPVSAMTIAGNWSLAYAKFFEHFEVFGNPVITASGRFVSILVATIQTLWRDDVLAALFRALIYAVAAGGPATIICYAIALSGEDIVDTREHKEGMQLLRGKKGIAHLLAASPRKATMQIRD